VGFFFFLLEYTYEGTGQRLRGTLQLLWYEVGIANNSSTSPRHFKRLVLIPGTIAERSISYVKVSIGRLKKSFSLQSSFRESYLRMKLVSYSILICQIVPKSTSSRVSGDKMLFCPPSI
jgi:hypothetical protein